MSKQQPRNRKALSLVAGLLLILLIILGDFVAGFVGIGSPAPTKATLCNNPGSILQCSTVPASITVSTGATSGSRTITFSPSFSAIPKSVTITPRSVSVTSSTYPIYSAVFLAVESAGQTWPNMPVAQTEIFGDTVHEIAVVGAGGVFSGASLASFTVNCPPGLGSNSATAVLRPMFSLDTGATWNPVAQSPTSLDFPVFLVCNTTSQNLVTNIASALQNAAATNVVFRVDGLNGGGVGDTPAFTQIQLTFFNTRNFYPTFFLLSKSTTNMVITAIYPSANQAGPITDTFDWEAQE